MRCFNLKFWGFALFVFAACFALVGCGPSENGPLSYSKSIADVRSVTPLQILYGDVLDDASLSPEDKEFLFGYAVLYGFYPFAHSDSLIPKSGTRWYTERLGKMEDYIDRGSSVLRPKIPMSSITLDLFYMYISMVDAFTLFIPAELMSFDMFLDDLESRDSVTDVGANVYPVNNVLVVMQTFTGSAAKGAGLLYGDTIISVNDFVVQGNKALYEAMAKGFPGNVVKLKIARNEGGSRVERDMAIVLQSYVPPTVTYEIIDSVPVIHISEFARRFTPDTNGTYGEFVTALKETQGYNSTVVDLRGNPGGDADMCVGVSMEMAQANDTLMLFKHSVLDSITGDVVILDDPIVAMQDGLAKDRYLVFLADTGSASCSEVVLTAVACNKKFPIVGSTTFGKGASFALLNTNREGTLMFTHEIVFDRFGETYHTRGIAPDILEYAPDVALNKALELAKEGSLRRVAGYSDHASPAYQYPESVLAKGGERVGKIPRKSDLGMYRIYGNPRKTLEK